MSKVRGLAVLPHIYLRLNYLILNYLRLNYLILNYLRLLTAIFIILSTWLYNFDVTFDRNFYYS